MTFQLTLLFVIVVFSIAIWYKNFFLCFFYEQHLYEIERMLLYLGQLANVLTFIYLTINCRYNGLVVNKLQLVFTY